MEILNSHLVVNVAGCDENKLQSNVSAIIEGVKAALDGVPVNLQINFYTQNNNLQFQNLINQQGEESEQWKN